MATTLAELDELVKGHAPPDWDKQLPRERLLDLLNRDTTIETIVLAADIRMSTALMREAINFKTWSSTMSRFVSATAKHLRDGGGWFDKFMGDGFLAYWPVVGKFTLDAADPVLMLCRVLNEYFHTQVLQDFRLNSRNLPTGIGLCLGIDAGPASLVTVADDLTVVGAPVVGAVRMVSAARKPRETIMNVHLGASFYAERSTLLKTRHTAISRDAAKTKEYEEQEVYRLEFLPIPPSHTSDTSTAPEPST